MGQALRRLSHPDLPPSGVVGGIWSDHELVLVPLEVSSHRDSLGSALAPSFSSTSSSGSAASASTSSTYFTTPSLTAESGLETSPSGSPSTGSRQVETYDREDLIITRTIIRPATHASTLRGMFSRPSSPLFSRPTSPLSRPNTPVFQALNCFRPGGFERDVGDAQTERRALATQPVLQVIVTQTREQYEQDRAFKEVVQEVYPEASRHRPRTAH